MLLGHYTRRERVTGLLVPSAGLQTIDANLTGSVSRVWVKEGQHIHEGQPVVTLSGDATSATMGQARAVITRRLKSQQQRFKSDRQALKTSMEQRQIELERQLALNRAQLNQIRSQLDLMRLRSTSELELLRRIEPLGKKGYVSAIQIEQQRSHLLQLEVEIRELTRQKLTLAQKISATKREIAQVPLDLTTRGNAIDRQLDSISQQLARNEAERSVVLRAPSSGIVSSLLAVPGKAVHGGEPLLSIVPEGSKLQAQLLVPSRAIGFVRHDSRVVLRYQSFPYQKFGQQVGHIRTISRSALSPAEVFSLTGLRANEPLYRVRVRLESQHILAYGKKLPLKPGMSLDADILMDRRSLLEWVFEPLYGLRQRVSAREVKHG